MIQAFGPPLGVFCPGALKPLAEAVREPLFFTSCLTMQLKQYLRRWGNGRAVRLPKEVLRAVDLQEGQSLAIHLEGRSIILTPLLVSKFSLSVRRAWPLRQCR